MKCFRLQYENIKIPKKSKPTLINFRTSTNSNISLNFDFGLLPFNYQADDISIFSSLKGGESCKYLLAELM